MLKHQISVKLACHSVDVTCLFIQERTLVGAKGAESEQDIQLSGLGIQPEHCVILIEDGGLVMEPRPNARCFINGVPTFERTPLHHGDRILWGNHHFFRVNCPKSACKDFI